MTLIQQRLHAEPVLIPGKHGQFEVIVDGKTVATRGGNWFTRSFGAGYPDLERVVEVIEKEQS